MLANLLAFLGLGAATTGSQACWFMVIDEAECALCSPSGDAKAQAASIEKMMSCSPQELQKMSENARHYFEEHFTKQKLLDELEEYFSK